MAFEAFKRSKKEKDVRDLVDTGTRDADPASYSMLPPEEMRTKVIRPLNEIGLPVRTAEGETYYELGGAHDPRGQRAVARMLKGILNVSDIVSLPDAGGDEKFYSWKTPLKGIEQNTTKEQFAAEQMLLGYVFNSNDHLFNRMSGWVNNGRYENEKAVHFDFGEDAYNFLRKPDREYLVAQLKQQSPETVAYLNGKVSELQDRFEGEQGRTFFKAIVDAGGAPVTELFGPKETFDAYKDIEPLDLVYRTFVGRIDGLSKLLHEIAANHPSDSSTSTDSAMTGAQSASSEQLSAQAEQDKEKAAQLLKRMTGK